MLRSFFLRSIGATTSASSLGRAPANLSSAGTTAVSTGGAAVALLDVCPAPIEDDMTSAASAIATRGEKRHQDGRRKDAAAMGSCSSRGR